MILVEGDTRNFEYSADIALRMDMDHLVATPSVALRFADALEQKGYDLRRMRFLYVSGEPFTKALFTALRRRYPNAGILNGVGVSEATVTLGHNSSFCESLFSAFGHNTYHLNTRDVWYEIVDGTLVVTPLHRAPFPLVKYDTGDTVRVHEHVVCSCGFATGPVVRVGARASGESYKMGSVIVHKRLVADALKEHAALVSDDFEVQIHELESGGRVALSLTLIVVPKKRLSQEELEAMQSHLERAISVLPGVNIAGAKRNNVIGDFKVVCGDVSGQRIVPPQELMLG